MSHEQSETIQNARGKWINVYGKKSKMGKRFQDTDVMLPGSVEHDTVEDAVSEAQRRSKAGDLRRRMTR